MRGIVIGTGVSCGVVVKVEVRKKQIPPVNFADATLAAASFATALAAVAAAVATAVALALARILADTLVAAGACCSDFMVEFLVLVVKVLLFLLNWP